MLEKGRQEVGQRESQKHGSILEKGQDIGILPEGIRHTGN